MFASYKHDLYRQKNDVKAKPLEIIAHETRRFSSRNASNAFINSQLEHGKACQRREDGLGFVVTVLTVKR